MNPWNWISSRHPITSKQPVAPITKWQVPPHSVLLDTNELIKSAGWQLTPDNKKENILELANLPAETLLQTEISKTDFKIRAQISNDIHVDHCDVITYTCPNFDSWSHIEVLEGASHGKWESHAEITMPDMSLSPEVIKTIENQHWAKPTMKIGNA